MTQAWRHDHVIDGNRDDAYAGRLVAPSCRLSAASL